MEKIKVALYIHGFIKNYEHKMYKTAGCACVCMLCCALAGFDAVCLHLDVHCVVVLAGCANLRCASFVGLLSFVFARVSRHFTRMRVRGLPLALKH